MGVTLQTFICKAFQITVRTLEYLTEAFVIFPIRSRQRRGWAVTTEKLEPKKYCTTPLFI